MTIPTATSFTGTATFTTWDEDPGWDTGAPVPRLAHAVVAFAFDGDLQGTSACQFVLHYTEEASGAVVGLERLDVRTALGEPGTVALRSEGTFGTAGVTVAWTTVPGSGTGALAGLALTGGFTAGEHAKEWTWWLGTAGTGDDGAPG
ncbi:MAG TPA: DUF3224 domain-containing protein [Acidimicrobiales bacterium]|nr:DUF3224 domain-containing protein [Acidimicrobiales bacterium]